MFYKPPMERKVECDALEDNYINCLFQKSLKDKVFTNQCVLDSVLWFHLECPKASSKFDDPVEFKKKFRDFFAQNKSMYDSLNNKTETTKRMEKEYGHTSAYAEDVTRNQRAQKYFKELQKYSPDHIPIDLDEEDPTEFKGLDQETPAVESLYGKKNEFY